MPSALQVLLLRSYCYCCRRCCCCCSAPSVIVCLSFLRWRVLLDEGWTQTSLGGKASRAGGWSGRERGGVDRDQEEMRDRTEALDEMKTASHTPLRDELGNTVQTRDLSFFLPKDSLRTRRRRRRLQTDPTRHTHRSRSRSTKAQDTKGKPSEVTIPASEDGQGSVPLSGCLGFVTSGRGRCDWKNGGGGARLDGLIDLP